MRNEEQKNTLYTHKFQQKIHYVHYNTLQYIILHLLHYIHFYVPFYLPFIWRGGVLNAGEGVDELSRSQNLSRCCIRQE